ncbi:MAG: hypothetical protein KXJ61_05410 [Hydrogenophaga sp.]|uniref:hypothetical protein n=1 Tax=Hydrogenophaga sp. TaxID=1904254 RepID=UPI001DA02F26|nr:hypothetical protein [Hydrogenophaga sp.]MBW0169648.1 hypothetical protein [Hydrogenophaga sp.]MBW0183270.1 hypothetical protein [Hydrogenophaga sp.]
MKSLGIRDDIRRQAVGLLLAHREGLHYSELHRMLRESTPSFNTGTINSSLWSLEVILPNEVWKPSKGLYMHCHFKDSEVIEDSGKANGNTASRVRESAFYRTFADWLKNEAEEVTHAIPLGGNVFRDRWGTPDVIGKRESRRSDVIKAPTEIVAAEIKVDTMQLVTAFGQACAYRLFCHRSYLVIPQQANEDEIARLDALCEISGIALVTFDSDAPGTPAFKVLVRPRHHQPDLFYTNRYLALIERELFS